MYEKSGISKNDSNHRIIARVTSGQAKVIILKRYYNHRVNQNQQLSST